MKTSAKGVEIRVFSSQRLMWQCDVMIKGVNSKRVLSEWLCRGGKRPGGVEQGVEQLPFLCCCTWSCSSAILWLYTVCLGGFNHMRRNACGFTGKKYRLHYTQGCLCSTAPDREDVWSCNHKKKYLQSLGREQLRFVKSHWLAWGNDGHSGSNFSYPSSVSKMSQV